MSDDQPQSSYALEPTVVVVADPFIAVAVDPVSSTSNLTTSSNDRLSDEPVSSNDSPSSNDPPSSTTAQITNNTESTTLDEALPTDNAIELAAPQDDAEPNMPGAAPNAPVAAVAAANVADAPTVVVVNEDNARFCDNTMSVKIIFGIIAFFICVFFGYNVGFFIMGPSNPPPTVSQQHRQSQHHHPTKIGSPTFRSGRVDQRMPPRKPTKSQKITLAKAGKDRRADPDLQLFNLEDMIAGRFEPRRPNGTWHGRKWVYIDSVGNLAALDASKLESTIILRAHHPDMQRRPTSHQMSADGRFVLLEYRVQQIFRHAKLSNYTLITLDPVVAFSSIRVAPGGNDAPIDYAAFGPDGSQMVVMQNRSVYYFAAAEEAANNNWPPFSSDPSPRDNSRLYRGTADWLYDDQILGGLPPVWWSPDGQQLAYASFNDEQIEMRSVGWRWTSIPGNSRQCDIVREENVSEPDIGYSAAKFANPVVTITLMVVALNQTRVLNFDLPIDMGPNDTLLTMAGWLGNDTFGALWMNRQQTRAVLKSCYLPSTLDYDEETQTCREVTEIKARTGWLQMRGRLFGDSVPGHHFVAVVQPFGQGDDYSYHLVTYRMRPSTNVSAASVESKVFDMNRRLHVDRIVHIDWNFDVIFYLANRLSYPGERQLYRVFAQRDSIGSCLTCRLNKPGNNYLHFDAIFGLNDPFLVLESQGPQLPRHDLYMWDIGANKYLSIDHRMLLENNTDLVMRTAGIKQSKPDLKHVENLGWMRVLRPYVQPGSIQKFKYPMLLQPYTEPGTYLGTLEWRLEWPEYMAFNRSMIVVQLDRRGSSRLRLDYTHAIHGQPGLAEADDLQNVAYLLNDTISEIDRGRIGIWGEGYGGYVAGMAVSTNRTNMFQCAALVAPGVDIGSYPTAFAERLMKVANDENEKTEQDRAYRASSLMEHVTAWYETRKNINLTVYYGDTTAGGRRQHTHTSTQKFMMNLYALWQKIRPGQMVDCNAWHQGHYLTDMTNFMTTCLNGGK